VPAVIDVARFIDERPLSSFQLRIYAASILITLLDGVDLLTVSLAAPLLAQEWAIPAKAFGPVFGAGPAGMAIGALLLGSLADHIGRKRLIIVATFLFGLSSWLTVLAHSVTELAGFRFLTGLGLGGVLPNLIALTTEYAPSRKRGSLTTLAFCGLSFGSMLAGIFGTWVMPALGWKSIFVLGGALPMTVAAGLPFVLPESIRFLAARGGRDAQIAAILREVAPSESIPPGAQFTAPDATAMRPSPARLFGSGRTATTVITTLIVVCNSFTLYFMLNWLPILLKQAGLTTQGALLSTVLLNGAGGVGAIVIGRFMDRYGSRRVMVVTCLLAALGVSSIGFAAQSAPLLLLVLLLAGGTILCTLLGMYVVIAEIYPTTLRSTGAGLTLGIGRVGSILGPMAGGWALAAQWPPGGIFVMAATPVLLSGGLLAVIGKLPRRFE
jgi:MFS transporter, AAHS family, 4-hydroxybenzoate transporter